MKHIIIVCVLAVAAGFAAFTVSARDITAQYVNTKLQELLSSEKTLREELSGGILKMDVDINLGDKQLTLNGLNGITGVKKFSGEIGSVLNIDATSDITMVEIQGGIKLIKRGKGKLILCAPASETAFSGGIEIFEGILTTTMSGNHYLPFGKSPNIVIHKGAVLLPNGCYGFLPSHTITLNGGSLGAGMANTYISNSFQPTIILTADSQYNPAEEMTLGSAIDLGTHTLTVAPTAQCKWKPSSIKNGTIYVDSDNLKLVNDIGKIAGSEPSANLKLGSTANIVGNYIYSVKDLTMAKGAQVKGTIEVYGSFRPDEAANGNVRLQTGATLDLNAQAEVWSAGNLLFEDEAKVTIDIHERGLASDTQIVVWTNPPANLNGLIFELDAASKAAGLELEQVSDGLMVKKNEQYQPYLKAVPNAKMDEGKIVLKIEGVAPKVGKEILEYVLESRSGGDWQEEACGRIEGEDDLTLTATLPTAEKDASAVKYFRVKVYTPN